MVRGHLAIDAPEAPALYLPHQRHQRDLGRVRRPTEHRLAEEHAPERDAVETTNEPVVLPRFDGMRMTHLEQAPVCLSHLVCDPRPILSGSRRRASLHHLKKTAIECDADFARTDPLAKRFRDMNL